MKMDTVWQAKVADSAIKSELVTLDVAGAEINWTWASLRLLGWSTGQRPKRAVFDFSLLFDLLTEIFLLCFLLTRGQLLFFILLSFQFSIILLLNHLLLFTISGHMSKRGCGAEGLGLEQWRRGGPPAEHGWDAVRTAAMDRVKRAAGLHGKAVAAAVD